MRIRTKETPHVKKGAPLADHQMQYHNDSVLKKYSPKLKIGQVGDKAKL